MAASNNSQGLSLFLEDWACYQQYLHDEVAGQQGSFLRKESKGLLLSFA
jgi:hypothetical protein